jgi:tungstate transport system substrate-binding protein
LGRTIRVCVMACFVMVFPLNSAWAKEKCDSLYGEGPDRFSLTTGSPGELGILNALAEAFSAGKSTSMCWQKAGSGESLKLLKDKKVDMIMVHAPAAEKKAVEDGGR